MGSSQKIIKGVYWTTITNVVSAAYGFFSVPMLIRYFGKSEYGLIGLAMSINVYMRLMDLGFASTNVRFFSKWLAERNFEKLSRAFQTSLAFYGIIGFVNAVVLFGVSFFAEKIFNVDAEQTLILKNLLYILSISAFISWLSSCFDQLIKGSENVAWTQRLMLLPKLLQIVVLLVTVYGKLSIVSYYALTCFSLFAAIPLFVRKIRQDHPQISFVPKINLPILREIMPYCLNLFSFGIFQFSFYNLRPVFLGIQGTVESVADFRILNGIITIVTMLGGAFVGVLLPSSAKAVAQQNRDAYYRMAYDGTKYISILLCFCCFGMMTVGKEIISLYVGDAYLNLIPWFYLWLLCTLTTHNQAISSLILAGANIKALSYSSAVASVLGLIVSWLTIPHYQIGGVVIGFIVYGLIQMFFYYLYYWPRKMEINSRKVFFKDFFPYVLVGVSAFVFVDVLPILCESLWTQFLVKGTIFCIFYMIVAFLILTPEDKAFFMKILRRNR